MARSLADGKQRWAVHVNSHKLYILTQSHKKSNCGAHKNATFGLYYCLLSDCVTGNEDQLHNNFSGKKNPQVSFLSAVELICFNLI